MPACARPSTDRPDPRTSWVEERLAELARASARGRTNALEELIAAHPEWDDERTIRLIYEDFCERQDRGEAASPRELLARFPQYHHPLGVLLDFDRCVRTDARMAAWPEPGERLGAFTLLAELGRGASGRVYLATDDELANRLVALKIQSIDQDEHLALAQLQHTHIIPIYSQSTFAERGLRVLCMPYLGGAGLDRLLDELAAVPPQARTGKALLDAIDRVRPQGLAPGKREGPIRGLLEGESWTRAVCGIVSCVADALHSAHQRGLIHLDVKPSNVLIAADGLPLLLDFHLARRPVAAGEVVIGRLGGTPPWMAPEQIEAIAAARLSRPSPRAVDARCDVYALGAVLAVALDGRNEPGVGQVDAIGWRIENPEVPPGLIAIVRRCLADNPSDRYASAAALSEDLRRHLSDLPLVGVPNRNPCERWAKWRRRRPGTLGRRLFGAAALGTLMAALAMIGLEHARGLAAADDAISRGRGLMLHRRYAEARAVYAGALARVAGRFDGSRGQVLREALAAARLGLIAEYVHELADTLRFRTGIGPPDATIARRLESIMPAIWQDRRALLNWSARSGDPLLRDCLRRDLWELAALWGAVLERDPLPGRHTNALRLRDEMEASDEPLPHDARSHYDLGRSHLRASRFREARQEFEIVSREFPQDFWPCFYLGLCEHRLGHFAAAAAAFRVCEALEPRSAECPYNRALALEARGEADQARASYSRALALNPGLAEAWLNRGILNLRQEAYPEAIADFDETLRLATEGTIPLRAARNRELAVRGMRTDRP
jgi:serine/threonine protein kinase/tetratricopeptide (TPR) repeat protein